MWYNVIVAWPAPMSAQWRGHERPFRFKGTGVFVSVGAATKKERGMRVSSGGKSPLAQGDERGEIGLPADGRRASGLAGRNRAALPPLPSQALPSAC